MNWITIKSTGLALLAGTVLAACGGGSSGGSTNSQDTSAQQNLVVTAPAASFSRVFDGTTSDGKPATALLQTDGSYFLVLSNSAAPHDATEVVLGTGTAQNASFASSNAMRLSLTTNTTQSPQLGTLSASFTARPGFDGNAIFTAATSNFSFVTDENASYKTLPSMSALAGTYTGSIATKDVGESQIKLTITADGKLTGSLSCGCSVSAALAPRADGTGYAAAIKFSDGHHPLANKSFTGNIYFDGAAKRLYIVGQLDDKTSGVIYVGTKP